MKNKISLTMIVVLLMALLAAPVSAAKVMDLDVDVRNQSGGIAQLSLRGEDGNPIYFTLEEGVTTITVPEGTYSYYASMQCGNLAGQWNVNVAKTLYLGCKNASPVMGSQNQAAGPKGASGWIDYACFTLIFEDGFVEFWDGDNWDPNSPNTWAEIVAEMNNWQGWARGGLTGPAIDTDCANPPQYDAYYNSFVIWW